MTNVIGLIAFSNGMLDEILMVEDNGLYALPEMSTDGLKADNIVEGAYELAEKININVEQISLCYVVKQQIPDSKEMIINYYFIIMASNFKDIPKGYVWKSKAHDLLDKSIYPKEFIESIKLHNENAGSEKGWVMGQIEIISDTGKEKERE